MIRIELATAETLARSGADLLGKTVRAVIAVREDGEIVGVGGVYVDGHRQVMFADLSDALRADKRALIRAVRMLQALAAKVRAPVHSIADPLIPGSRTLLEHIGFKPLAGDLYRLEVT